MSGHGTGSISFMGRMVSSIRLKVLYADGMDLVEETSSYFDREGRSLSKELPRIASALYVSESVHLTTRLMQMVSWLLLQRALENGEMSFEQVITERKKIRFDSSDLNRTPAPGWDDIPCFFQNLVESSLRLQRRIMLLDKEIYAGQVEGSSHRPNNVRAQIDLLKTCFGNV
ncbi:DUF1465 family protein [Candidatus Liberibacter sp.]|uniref:DUF1465 family protein n=1 Tax=Candidatus Liberibacter sp. TaxID=34022 RepID=UPI0015F67CD5|nr:DUF1465 family protein [Candidatus Liberibacter sp.]MBA5723653.1 DUF1465 family protein [Candidatus Liberibacter sp.]